MVERTVVERTVVETTVVETTSGGKHLSPYATLTGGARIFLLNVIIYHSAGKRDRDLTPSPYNARWPEGPRAPLSERSEL